MRGFGKLGFERVKPAHVSHDSHRKRKQACANMTSYVKSASAAAWGNSFECPYDAQRSYFASVGIG